MDRGRPRLYFLSTIYLPAKSQGPFSTTEIIPSVEAKRKRKKPFSMERTSFNPADAHMLRAILLTAENGSEPPTKHPTSVAAHLLAPSVEILVAVTTRG